MTPGRPLAHSASAAPQSWRERLSALANVPPLLRMVWDTSRWLTTATLALRLVSAGIPVLQLWVGKLIIDQIVHPRAGRSVWAFLAMEIGLAVLSDVLARATGLCDSLLGDRFTNHVSLRLMEHAGQLDLVSFEDPVFSEKMERARRQTTSRLGMLAILATSCQQIVTLVSLSGAVILFSPWFLILLVATIVPAFLGET